MHDGQERRGSLGFSVVRKPRIELVELDIRRSSITIQVIWGIRLWN